MRLITTTGVALLLLAAQALAQTDEAKFNQKQADRLNAFAKKAFDKGFPRQAKLIWMQAIKLYDRDGRVRWQHASQAYDGHAVGDLFVVTERTRGVVRVVDRAGSRPLSRRSLPGESGRTARRPARGCTRSC